jgi:hypothetical protein
MASRRKRGPVIFLFPSSGGFAFVHLSLWQSPVDCTPINDILATIAEELRRPAGAGIDRTRACVTAYRKGFLGPAFVIPAAMAASGDDELARGDAHSVPIWSTIAMTLSFWRPD